ncbi:hypothetical protein HFQ13_10640 [Acidithiobacillus sp. VAN18-1]|uniref:Uncharacterized protein n=1 Tax=Igneacidithiobacillus copahuensis TaxID=2724909 RepID=A0AAE2YRH8_9PROT|nr:hypothetical protein [Igneacidithiobacillus copahuensis]MBU2788648.1 hypothetical protein [Igneacidithiobacillus copahuensis]MBU2796668.1 hypothetical protein [Acidithiobacillus sp. VAN18-2]
MYQSPFNQDRFSSVDLSGFPSRSIVADDSAAGVALDRVRSSVPDPSTFSAETPLPVRVAALARLILEHEGIRASMKLDDDMLVPEALHRDDPRLIQILDRARAIWSADKEAWPQTLDAAIHTVEAEVKDIMHIADMDGNFVKTRNVNVRSFEDLNETIKNSHFGEDVKFLLNPNAMSAPQGSQWMLPDPGTFYDIGPGKRKPPANPYPMSEGDRPLDRNWRLLDQQNPPVIGPLQGAALPGAAPSVAASIAETGPYRLVPLRADGRGNLEETADPRDADRFGVAFREKPDEFWADEKPFRVFDDPDTARRFMNILEGQQNMLPDPANLATVNPVIEGVQYRKRAHKNGEREYYQANDADSNEPMTMSLVDSWQVRRYLMTGELSPEMAQHFAQRLDSGATLTRFAESNLQAFAEQAGDDPHFETFRKLEGQYYRNLGADLQAGQPMRNFSMDDMPGSLNRYVQDHRFDRIHHMDVLREGISVPVTQNNLSAFAAEQSLPLENSPLPGTVKAHVVIRPRVLRNDVTQTDARPQGVEFVQEGDVFRGYIVTQEAQLTPGGDTFLTQPPISAGTHERAMELAQDMAEKPLTVQHLQNVVERDTGIESLQEYLNLDVVGYQQWLDSAATAPATTVSAGDAVITQSSSISPLAVLQLEKDVVEIRGLSRGLTSEDPAEQGDARDALRALQQRNPVVAAYVEPLVAGILLNARNHDGEISGQETLRNDVARLPEIVPGLSPAETVCVILDGWRNDLSDKVVTALQVLPERHAANIAGIQTAMGRSTDVTQWPDQTVSMLPMPDLAPIVMQQPLAMATQQSLQPDGTIHQAQPGQPEFVVVGTGSDTPGNAGTLVRAFPDTVSANAFMTHLDSLGLARAALANNLPFAMNGMEFQPVQSEQGLRYRASVMGQEQDQKIDPNDLAIYLHQGMLAGTWRSLVESVGPRLQHPRARADYEALANGSTEVQRIPDWIQQANLPKAWPIATDAPESPLQDVAMPSRDAGQPDAAASNPDGQQEWNSRIPADVSLGEVNDSRTNDVQASDAHTGPVEQHIQKTLNPEPPKSEAPEAPATDGKSGKAKIATEQGDQGKQQPDNQQNQKSSTKNDDEKPDQNRNQGQGQNVNMGGGGFSLFGRRSPAPVTAAPVTAASQQSAASSGRNDDAAIAHLQKMMYDAPVETYHVETLHEKIKKDGLQPEHVDEIREMSARMDRDAKKASTPAERENLRKVGQAVDNLSRTVEQQPDSLEKEGFRKHLHDIGKAIAEAIMRLFGLDRKTGMSGPS